MRYEFNTIQHHQSSENDNSKLNTKITIQYIYGRNDYKSGDYVE